MQTTVALEDHLKPEGSLLNFGQPQLDDLISTQGIELVILRVDIGHCCSVPRVIRLQTPEQDADHCSIRGPLKARGVSIELRTTPIG
ncbi:hypothetical protein PoB_005486900 [Plakobranchus ocellatus]|uniref:Ferrous iron transporter FeoA domain-containing protein n=1 Tax=Plakobranchus ocellatus TaxID=259542 RepID=A0AAV4CCD0_9GAST|nr:hypothetical protein PoB_005486900 [Plakobranchus ocellatus]